MLEREVYARIQIRIESGLDCVRTKLEFIEKLYPGVNKEQETGTYCCSNAVCGTREIPSQSTGEYYAMNPKPK